MERVARVLRSFLPEPSPLGNIEGAAYEAAASARIDCHRCRFIREPMAVYAATWPKNLLDLVVSVIGNKCVASVIGSQTVRFTKIRASSDCRDAAFFVDPFDFVVSAVGDVDPVGESTRIDRYAPRM
jgi:hypothetical protein